MFAIISKIDKITITMTQTNMSFFWQNQAKTYGQANDLETKVRFEIAKRIASIAKAGDFVLEIGCGNGAFIQILHNLRPDLVIHGVDSSPEMLAIAKDRLSPNIVLIHETAENYLEAHKKISPKFIVFANTLHNLSGTDKISTTITQATKILDKNGCLFFDVRNAGNPFINRGYRKNRKADLQFHTLQHGDISKILQAANLCIVEKKPIFYNSLQEAGKQNKKTPTKLLYSIYLKLTSRVSFSPYYIVHAQKQQKDFISIIWGYHKQFAGFSLSENYQLAPLILAKKHGYCPTAYLINEKFPIEKDPHFDQSIHVRRYTSFFSFVFFLTKNRNNLIYANSVIWQNLFIVPILCRRAVFMAHDSIKRRSVMKEKLQNFFLKYYWRIRVISIGEKEYLKDKHISSNKIFVAPLAIDTQIFTNDSISARKDLVLLGNITPDSNIETILLALKIVTEKKHNIKLHIFGEVRIAIFAELIQQMNLKEHIIHHGAVTHKELAKELLTYKILINSTESTGQHLSLFEAYLSGVALCIPNSMQFNHVFKDAALFHDLHDVNMLAKNILRYLNDPTLAEKHTHHARECIKKTYNFDTTNSDMKRLFDFSLKEQIAVFAPEQHLPLIEGIQKSAHNTCAELQNLGTEMTIFSQLTYGTPFQEKRAIEYIFHVQKNRLLKYIEWFRRAKKSTESILLREYKSLLVFSLDWSFLPILFKLSKNSSHPPIHLVLFSLRETQGPAKLFIKNTLTNTKIHYWCFSSYLAKRLIELGVNKNRIHCEPVFFTKPNHEPYKREKNTHKKIAYLSSSSNKAGSEQILELAKKLPDVKFIFAIRKFSSKEEKRVQAFIKKVEKLNMPNISFVRNISNMQKFLSTIDVVLMPPQTQIDTMAIPLVALEASYAGCKVIMSNLPIFKELQDAKLAELAGTEDELIDIIKKNDHKDMDVIKHAFSDTKDFAKKLQSFL